MSSALLKWELEQTKRWKRWLGETWQAVRLPVCAALLAGAGFIVGVQAATAPGSRWADFDAGQLLHRSDMAVRARQGELDLARLELTRMRKIMDYSGQYRIPAPLATSIYDIALSEGIEPDLAFRLVRVESGFFSRAISPKGAVGLTQLMPSTAFGMEPSLGYSDLFHQETNLRLGFRYLREMLEKYQGDLRLALLAYNRGPGTVDAIRRDGRDPGNGYARAVMGGL